MAKTNTGRKKTKMTEIRAMRIASGITVKEMHEELGMPNGLYSAHECGNRRYKESRYEEFYKEVAYGIERIKRRRLAESYEINKHMELNNEGELEEVLMYQPLSDKLFEQALQLIAVGNSVIKASVILDVDELDIQSRLDKIEAEKRAIEEAAKKEQGEKDLKKMGLDIEPVLT